MGADRQDEFASTIFQAKKDDHVERVSDVRTTLKGLVLRRRTGNQANHCIPVFYRAGIADTCHCGHVCRVGAVRGFRKLDQTGAGLAKTHTIVQRRGPI